MMTVPKLASRDCSLVSCCKEPAILADSTPSNVHNFKLHYYQNIPD